MRHLLLFVTALPWMVVLASPAQAGWYEFWYGAKRDHRQNHAWPEPFAARDRQAVAAPFDAMVRAGWRSQTTLGTHDFDPETQSLNEAGERRLRWMATQAPEPYRTIYVAQGRDQATAERLEAFDPSAVTVAEGEEQARTDLEQHHKNHGHRSRPLLRSFI